MAVLDHHDLSAISPHRETNHRALAFALTWVGFFALIGLATWIGSLF
jgi:hypothetical protein